MRLRNYLLLLGIIFFVASFPLYGPEFYQTHDGENHVARFAAYFKAFSDGHIPPRWAVNLNFRYGSAVLLFFYPLPGYLSVILHSLNISYELSFKLLSGTAFVLAPLFFYFFSKKIFKNEVAFILSVFYGLGPYHILNIFVRGDIGEQFAFVFIPLVLLGIESYAKKRTTVSLLFVAISLGLLILSHNGLSLMFFPVIILYSLLRVRTIKRFTGIMLAIVLGMFLSAFFWIPALFESKYVNAKLFLTDVYAEHFPSFLSIIYSPWGYGDKVNDSGGLSPQIGIILFGLSIVSILYFSFKQDISKEFIFWSGVFLIGIFVTTPYSSVLWSKIPLLTYYEFPWRFTALSSFASVMLVGFLLEKVNKSLIRITILVVFILSVLPFLSIMPKSSLPDSYYEEFTGTTYFHGEASPIWTAGDFSAFPKDSVEVIDGEGTVTNYERKTHIHTYMVDARSPVRLLDNTAYFPGWNAYVNGKKTLIEFQDMNHRGLITFSVPKGNQSIKVIFEETKVRLLADSISVMSIILVFTLFLFRRRINILLSRL